MFEEKDFSKKEKWYIQKSYKFSIVQKCISKKHQGFSMYAYLLRDGQIFLNDEFGNPFKEIPKEFEHLKITKEKNFEDTNFLQSFYFGTEEEAQFFLEKYIKRGFKKNVFSKEDFQLF